MEVDPINDWEFAAASNVVNLVIVGKAGNGKSATGNSILGRDAFLSDVSSSGVTCTSELQETVVTDGRILKVIDTPGFDFSTPSDVICREIVKCVDLAEDGIHAVLMVFSIGCRFTKEEEAAVKCMKSLFGDEIFNYMIIVFTGGDTLESKGKSLRDYSSTFPDYLKNLIELCSDRVILFDNTTSDTSKRKEQVNELLSLVESVIEYNGGVPYSDMIFAEVKKGALLQHQKKKELEAKVGCSEEELSELMKEKKKLYDDQLERITEMVEEKLKLAVERLEKQLAEEQAARLKAERVSEGTEVEIQRLKAETEELRRRLAERPNCAIS